MRILVVDDEKIKRVTLADDLTAQGHEVVTAVDGAEAMDRLACERFDVVVTDLRMPKLDGIGLLKHLKRNRRSDVAVIVMTAYGSIPTAVEAMKLGAFDFVTKPFRNEDVFPLMARIERKKTSAAGTQPRPAWNDSADIALSIVGQSPSMQRAKQMVEVCARTDANVLLCGETGTGKDLIAAVIHRNSHRRQSRLVKVGCTLFPPHLIESELFGHEKGAFTGADRQHEGRFELAQEGTLYLDDVDDIPLDEQVKLLRVIEEKVFERVGGTTSIHADVRIIASTKCDLLERTEQGAFRKDLYYRLDVLRINIPPLRQRLNDVPALADQRLKQLSGTEPYRIDPDALEALRQHDWPGNVRELNHALERAFLVGGGHVTAGLLTADGGITSHRNVAPRGFQAVIGAAERQLLADALHSCGGNKSAAATALGMKLSTFRDKLAKHGLL